jgi:hypothetical protein
MLTQTGMLAMTIHEDRVRGYEDRARLRRFETRTTTATTSRTAQLRSLFGRTFGAATRQVQPPQVATSARS